MCLEERNAIRLLQGLRSRFQLPVSALEEGHFLRQTIDSNARLSTLLLCFRRVPSRKICANVFVDRYVKSAQVCTFECATKHYAKQTTLASEDFVHCGCFEAPG